MTVLRDLDMVRLSRLMQVGFSNLLPYERERIAQLTDTTGGWFTRIDRRAGRVVVTWGDVTLVDEPEVNVLLRPRVQA